MLIFNNRKVDLSSAINIFVPFSGTGPQLTGYNFDFSKFIPKLKVNSDGRGVNCDLITIIPHVHGTHIESTAHIMRDTTSTLSQSQNLPPLLLSKIINGEILNDGSVCTDLHPFDPFVEALLIRTGWLNTILLDNADVSLINLADYKTPFLPIDLVRDILRIYPNIRVLLIDSISIDPINDEGQLLAHKAFLRENCRFIVELCNIPSNPTIIDAVGSGGYLALSLNISPIDSDGIPCRPILFKLI